MAPPTRSAAKRATGVAAVALAVAAVVRELRTPPRRRRWHGRILGVPYDFRVPTWRRAKATWWSPRDRRVLKPRVFGLGWDVNVGRVVRLLTGR